MSHLPNDARGQALTEYVVWSSALALLALALQGPFGLRQTLKSLPAQRESIRRELPAPVLCRKDSPCGP